MKQNLTTISISFLVFKGLVHVVGDWVPKSLLEIHLLGRLRDAFPQHTNPDYESF